MRTKLRHPIRAIREPFGTAGLIVACIALIAALGGSALAAGALTSKQKKEVKKIAKKYAGKPGAPGAAGPAGPAGPQGPQGAQGAAGANGKDGTNGTNGTNGISPTGTKFSGEKGGCTEGGVEFKGANTTFACNGVKGADGETGFTETLPPGETLMGTWSVGQTKGQILFVDIPFGIPLSVPPTVEYMNFGEKNEDCPGAYKEPAAEPGFLCIYEFEGNPIEEFQSVPGLRFGAQLILFNLAEEPWQTFGSWAVTAHEEL